MENLTVVELGNIGSKEQAEKIVKKLSGKTIYNFIVQYGNCAGNYPVSVMTEKEGADEQEFKDMVLFVLACEL